MGHLGHDSSYGALTEAAARRAVPPNPTLKPASEFRLIGKPQKRIDGPAIVQGKAHYGMDVRVPGMLVAVIARCPFLGGKIASFDATRAMSCPGVRHSSRFIVGSLGESRWSQTYVGGE